LIGRFRTRLLSIGQFRTRLIFIGRFPVPFSVTKVYHSIFKENFFFFFWFVLEGAIFLFHEMAIFFFFQNGENLVFSWGVFKTLNFHKIIHLLKNLKIARFCSNKFL
jgi:hypothetical protein